MTEQKPLSKMTPKEKIARRINSATGVNKWDTANQEFYLALATEILDYDVKVAKKTDKIEKIKVYLAELMALGANKGVVNYDDVDNFARLIADLDELSPEELQVAYEFGKQAEQKARNELIKEIRQRIANEFRKAQDESHERPFPVDNLNQEHKLIWSGEANAFSETLDYLDSFKEKK